MIDEIIMEGPTVEEALDAALEQMGVQLTPSSMRS